MPLTNSDKRRKYQTLVHAISSIVSDDMPDNIQYLPPNKHTIHATKNGKPAELTVDVSQKTAELLQKSFDRITASGIEQVFLDFNHDDAEASAWVTGFYWGGDDPEDGGVRAKVEWTSAGEDALKGKNFRKFSPTFTVNSRGEIDGTTINAGGLVNRPAFKEITPVIAGENLDDETGESEMKKYKSQMADEKEETKKLEEIQSEEVVKEEEEKEETKVSSEEIEEDEDKVESVEELKEKVQKLEAALEELSEEKKEREVTAAKELVEQAVAEGRIPAQNEEVRAKWEEMLVADPSTKGLLLASPVDPAFDRVISAQGPKIGAGALNKAEAQMKEVHEYQAKNKTSFEAAWTAVSQDKPELF